MPFELVKEQISVKQADPAVVKRLCRDLSIDATVATLFAVRGLHTAESCKRFFRPELSHLHDPFIFSDMEKAVDRILHAIKSKERIAVYGDYDVDGVTATALLVRSLTHLGAECTYYLPNRLIEGYGLSENGVAELAASNVQLIISVDCGISAINAAEKARSLGIDLIITDHHEPKETLPAALAIINPKVKESRYPDTTLAGVGVALKLCQALGTRAGKSDDFWKAYLDLAAVGTAADIVPLTGENRVITKFGFEQLGNTQNPGLKALIQQRRLTGKKLSTSEVVFMLAPCVNAVGRLGDPRRGVELLLTPDPSIADLYARELVEANNERRAIDSRVQEEALLWIQQNCDPRRDFAIVAGNSSWHCGVIGIVASKVIEKFHRPTILFSFNDDGTARGSGRSVPGLHLLEALQQCESLLDSFGGHAAAAGMVIKQSNIDDFRNRFNEVVKQRLRYEDLTAHVLADAEVALPEMTPKLFRIITQMEPFGPGNMRPVFLCRNCKHRYGPRLVGDNHIKMSITDGSTSFDAIAFNFGHRLTEIKAAQGFSLAFALDENEWNGQVNLQLKIKGVAS